jgi:hypothetical protein
MHDMLGEEEWAAMFAPDGLARHVTWTCDDGWLVGYTTERIRHGGANEGKFAAMAWRPYGRGARGGRRGARQWKRVYFRTFSKRKSARARAEKMYHQHSK